MYHGATINTKYDDRAQLTAAVWANESRKGNAFRHILKHFLRYY